MILTLFDLLLLASHCRPFLASIGDLRSSRQLLRDRTSDLRMTFQKVSFERRAVPDPALTARN
eukprot:3941365-Rhodomonas_salina.2